MKKNILLLLLLTGVIALAQTNLPAAKKGPRQPTEITSDAADFDLNARLAVYRGHVVVTDPDMTLKCDRLVVFIPEANERLNHIEAQTNVVIEFSASGRQPARATGSLAVYRFTVVSGFTNETVTLTGNPRVESAEGTLTGSLIRWDRAKGSFHADDPHMISKQTFGGPGGTNASPLKLY